MKLDECTLVLRPRTVGELLDLACRFTFSESAGSNARLGAAVLLPSFALGLAGRYLLEVDAVWLWLLAIPLANWLEAGFTLSLSRHLFGEKLSLAGALKLVLSRLWAFSLAILVKSFMFCLSGIFLIGPFISWPSGTLVNEAVLLEGASGSASWGRSRNLVQQSNSGFGAAASIFAARVGFVLGLEALGQSLTTDLLQLGKPFGSFYDNGFTPFALLGLLLSVPFTATVRFLFYVDTRTRADGWDIQVKLMAIQAKAHSEEAFT